MDWPNQLIIDYCKNGNLLTNIQKALRAIKNLLKSVLEFLSKLEFGSVGFRGEGKTGYMEKNLLQQGKESTRKSTHIYGVNTRINPRPLQWEASALVPLCHPRSPIINTKDLFFKNSIYFSSVWISQSDINLRWVFPCEQDIPTYQQRETTKTYGLNVSEKSRQWIYHKDWVVALGVH